MSIQCRSKQLLAGMLVREWRKESSQKLARTSLLLSRFLSPPSPTSSSPSSSPSPSPTSSKVLIPIPHLTQPHPHHHPHHSQLPHPPHYYHAYSHHHPNFQPNSDHNSTLSDQNKSDLILQDYYEIVEEGTDGVEDEY